MSREDATYFFLEKCLDPDTELGVSVTSELELVGVIATDIPESGSIFFQKKSSWRYLLDQAHMLVKGIRF